MSVELPKDAEGREIPLDTKLLYDKEGNPKEVSLFTYAPRSYSSGWNVVLVGGFERFASAMHLTPPDSWEKLLEDLDKGEDICDYFEECPAEMYGKSCSDCKKAALKNIASRIRELKGENDA